MKLADINDLTAVTDMAVKFVNTTAYAPYSDRSHLETILHNLIIGDQTKGLVIYEPGQGFLAGATGEFPFGPKQIASEIAWWVEPDSRGSGLGTRLLQAFEYWAKEKAGCDLLTMAGLDDSVGKMYEKLGYALNERAYLKVL